MYVQIGKDWTGMISFFSKTVQNYIPKNFWIPLKGHYYTSMQVTANRQMIVLWSMVT